MDFDRIFLLALLGILCLCVLAIAALEYNGVQPNGVIRDTAIATLGALLALARPPRKEGP